MLLKTDEFQEIFEHFGVPYLSSSEEDLIKEYVKILLPLTRALDILQADKKVSIGFLLLTIVVLKKQLERLQTNQRIKHGKPLINGLLSGVNNRFRDMFSDDELRLEAFLHPRSSSSSFFIKLSQEGSGFLASSGTSYGTSNFYFWTRGTKVCEQ